MALALSASRTCGFASGTALRQKSSRAQARRVQTRVATPVKAKYGDESQFFDLDEDDKRYPSLQAEFFERAAAPLQRRESLIALIAISTDPSVLILMMWKGLANGALKVVFHRLVQDLENTVGSWELYGYEDEKRYPKTQSEFFERAAAPLTRKTALLALIFGGGTGAILTWGAKGSKDVALPITVGPKNGGEKGPRGKI